MRFDGPPPLHGTGRGARGAPAFSRQTLAVASGKPRYADKYRAGGQPIHLVGVEFSRATRNITAFETADA